MNERSFRNQNKFPDLEKLNNYFIESPVIYKIIRLKDIQHVITLATAIIHS